MEDLVSIIIPTYNREKTIVKSVQSVLNQTYTEIEVIVVDDGSIDGTKSVISSIKDERLRYIEISSNKGAGAARNVGVGMAIGKYIAFHDSDDYWLTDKLSMQMKVIREYPEYGLVYSAYLMHLQYGIDHIVPPMDGSLKLEGNIFDSLLVRNTIGAPTIVLTKEVFEEVGGFDESMRSLEDWDFALKVAKRYPIGFVNRVLLEVTCSDGGISSNQANYYKNRCYLLGKYKNEYVSRGLWDKAVESILLSAKNDGVLDQVAQLILLHL